MRPLQRNGKARAGALLMALAAWLLPAPAYTARANEGGEGKGGKIAPAPEFVPMSEIAVPITDGGAMLGTLRFTLVLQARDAAAAGPLTDDTPRLRAVALAQGIEFARLRASPDRPVDVATLSTDVGNALRAAAPDIERVLVVAVMASA